MNPLTRLFNHTRPDTPTPPRPHLTPDTLTSTIRLAGQVLGTHAHKPDRQTIQQFQQTDDRTYAACALAIGMHVMESGRDWLDQPDRESLERACDLISRNWIDFNPVQLDDVDTGDVIRLDHETDTRIIRVAMISRKHGTPVSIMDADGRTWWLADWRVTGRRPR